VTLRHGWPGQARPRRPAKTMEMRPLRAHAGGVGVNGRKAEGMEQPPASLAHTTGRSGEPASTTGAAPQAAPEVWSTKLSYHRIVTLQRHFVVIRYRSASANRAIQWHRMRPIPHYSVIRGCCMREELACFGPAPSAVLQGDRGHRSLSRRRASNTAAWMFRLATASPMRK
jgi:hypothetical protein